MAQARDTLAGLFSMVSESLERLSKMSTILLQMFRGYCRVKSEGISPKNFLKLVEK